MRLIEQRHSNTIETPKEFEILIKEHPISMKILNNLWEGTRGLSQINNQKLNNRLIAITSQGTGFMTGRGLINTTKALKGKCISRTEAIDNSITDSFSLRKKQLDTDDNIDIKTLKNFTGALLQTQADTTKAFLKEYAKEGEEKDRTSDIENILQFLNKTEPNDPVVVFSSEKNSRILNLHMDYVSASSLTQMKRFIDDINAIRNGEEITVYKEKGANHPVDLSKVEHINGVSWIVRPGFKTILKRAGITEEEGLIMKFYNTNQQIENILHNGYPYENSIHELTLTKVLRASVNNILFSAKHVREFMENCSLPDVGEIIFPSSLIFRSDEQQVKQLLRRTRPFLIPFTGDDYS